MEEGKKVSSESHVEFEVPERCPVGKLCGQFCHLGQESGKEIAARDRDLG